MMRRWSLPLLLLAAACGDPPDGEAPQDAVSPAPGTDAAWTANPSEVDLAAAGDTLRIATGPHVVAWDPAAGELEPPYEVSAVLQKRSGRLHEGVGLVFGGRGLDRPEAEQEYSYFLVRGDGSFLVKNRRGPVAPVVRNWTRHPAVRRDADGSGRPNEVGVTVSDSVVVFRVNGAEVARVPAGELSLRGRAGVRAAHDVDLAVVGFRAGAQP